MRERSFKPWAVAVAVSIATLLPAGFTSAEDYVPASSGKRFTPIRGPELRVLTGLEVGVPIFLDNDASVVRPGGGFGGWVGLDIGWMAFSAGFGASWNPIDLDNVEGGDGLGRSPLARLYISPEVRFQVPKSKAVLPYLSGAFDANWWRHREVTTLTCSFWYCLNRASFSFAPGFTGRLGMGIRVADRIYLDLGAKFSISGTGDFFPSIEMWVTPYIGVIYRGEPD